MSQRRDGQETREALLREASRLFAAKGFHAVTVAEICREAGTNIAAVNYHFRSKEELYTETWHRAFQEEFRSNPPGGGVDPAASPEERLRGRIRALVRRFLSNGSGSRLGALLSQELAAPTGVIAMVHREWVLPVRRETHALLRELLGPGAEDRDVLLVEMSIIHQFFATGIRRTLGMRCGKGSEMPPGEWGLAQEPPFLQIGRLLDQEGGEELVTDHVVAFSLAGIQAIRGRIETRGGEA